MSYQNILTAVSHLSDLTNTIRIAKDIAKRDGAKVTLIHPFQQLAHMGLGYALPSVLDIEHDQYEHAKELLNLAIEEEGLEGCDSKIELGPAKDVILKYATNTHADLIIIDSEKHSRMSRKTAESIMREANCDVLIVQQEA